MNTETIGVIGLGYVGLPLAVLLASRYEVVGFDISLKRLGELLAGHDTTLEVDDDRLRSVLGKRLLLTDDYRKLSKCSFFIVTVPTPVTVNHEPDLEPLEAASVTVGKVIKKGDVVVYESTVYPGTTEAVCIPVIENVSGLKLNEDFSVGYSPERINPGDRVHTVDKITKIVSASSPEALDRVEGVYASVIS
ncbi:MAG: nucleotide sugar dehydrogenase, partial [Muribaculaceae bacterium]|nr:nucleotide sugar dehydrogenase [Muribaculaceae bacterium]